MTEGSEFWTAVNLRLTRDELEHLILWGHQASLHATEVGLPFEPDEHALLEKMRALRPAGTRVRHWRRVVRGDLLEFAARIGDTAKDVLRVSKRVARFGEVKRLARWRVASMEAFLVNYPCHHGTLGGSDRCCIVTKDHTVEAVDWCDGTALAAWKKQQEPFPAGTGRSER